MISARKLSTLPRKTRLRKILTLTEEWDRLIEQRKPPLGSYVSEVLELVREEKRVDERVRRLAEELQREWPRREDAPALGAPSAAGEGGETVRGPAGQERGEERARGPADPERGGELRRKLEHLRFALMESLGLSPADWDFYDPETSSLSRDAATLLPMRIYIDDVRSPFNVGSIFRTAEAFGAEQVYLSEYTARPDHKRALRTSMGCTDVLPWRITELTALDPAERGVLFALELGGTAIDEFEFPDSGTVVIGSEELGVSPELRSMAAREGGIVSIPLSGAKASLNVAVAFGILMQHWHASILRTGT
jgi:TrmH family RNA methyltransferase